MTYHPILRWRCSRCRHHGEVTCDVLETAEVRWNRVIVAHCEVAPLCCEEYGEGGIAVDATAGRLPEVSE